MFFFLPLYLNLVASPKYSYVPLALADLLFCVLIHRTIGVPSSIALQAALLSCWLMLTDIVDVGTAPDLAEGRPTGLAVLWEARASEVM